LIRRDVLVAVELLLLVSVATAAAAQKPVKPAPVPIYVTSAEMESDKAHGMRAKPPKAVADVRWLIDHNFKIPKHQIVSAAQPDRLTLRIDGVDAKMLSGGLNPITMNGDTRDEITVSATLLVGDYRRSFTGSGDDRWTANVQMLKSVIAFIADNRGRLLGAAQ
jgi:hypothetical protein